MPQSQKTISSNIPAWSSRMAFTMAAIGAAVGLGNIWKFPYMVGTQGGGAFVLIYLASIFVIAIPVAAAELITGRGGNKNAVGSVVKMAEHTNSPKVFAPVGYVGVLGSFILLTFYTVIAGWVMAYVWRAMNGALSNVTPETTGEIFNNLLADPIELIFWQVSFIGLTGFIISRNIRDGLERANMILMPLLLIMLVLIVFYGAIEGNIQAALAFLFTPDFSKISSETVLSAIGHGFFSVGVGAAMLITYASYIADNNVSIGRAAILIGLADTGVALLAGIGIFSIVFAQNLDPAAGPGLIFTTLPLAFAQLPGGTFIAIVFFLLVLFAALTSALALTEVVVLWVHEQFNMSRKKAAAIVLGVAFIIGLTTVFSFNIWADVRLASEGVFADKTLFDAKDYIASNILLPLGGLLIVAFAGWVIPKETSRRHFNDSEVLYKLWLILARFIAPAGVVWVFLENL